LELLNFATHTKGRMSDARFWAVLEQRIRWPIVNPDAYDTSKRVCTRLERCFAVYASREQSAETIIKEKVEEWISGTSVKSYLIPRPTKLGGVRDAIEALWTRVPMPDQDVLVSAVVILDGADVYAHEPPQDPTIMAQLTEFKSLADQRRLLIVGIFNRTSSQDNIAYDAYHSKCATGFYEDFTDSQRAYLPPPNCEYRLRLIKRLLEEHVSSSQASPMPDKKPLVLDLGDDDYEALADLHTRAASAGMIRKWIQSVVHDHVHANNGTPLTLSNLTDYPYMGNVNGVQQLMRVLWVEHENALSIAAGCGPLQAGPNNGPRLEPPPPKKPRFPDAEEKEEN